MIDVMTTNEVADLLDCEVKLVEERLRCGELPGLKMGRSWLCPRQALMETLNDLARSNLGVRMAATPIAGRPVSQRGRKRTAPPSLSPVPSP